MNIPGTTSNSLSYYWYRINAFTSNHLHI